MSTNDTAMIEQQRKRRNRISRTKNLIVLAISIWMIISLIAIVILSVALVRLNGRVERLTQTLSGRTPNIASEQIQNKIQPTESFVTEDDSQTDHHVETGIDTPDNVAQDGDKHKVYLTFDSSPGENTNRIMDVLKQYNVKATFFVSGDSSEEAKKVYRRIVEEGHTLGMHSYSNQYSTIYASAEAFEKDYEQIYAYLKEVTGVSCLYYRFPGGSGNGISNVDMAEFVHILNEKNVSYFDWNVSAGDTAENCSADDIVSGVTGQTDSYKTSVVLLHDDGDKPVTVEALGPLIEALQKAGDEILPIDEQTKLIQYIKADSVE